MKSNGIVLYEGPSQLTGTPVVVVATGLKTGTSNLKTGNMVQVWILDAQASKAAPTEAVCGDCPHAAGACYVSWWQAPHSILKSYRAGSYPVWDGHSPVKGLTGRKIRMGAAGDPVAAPLSLWQALAAMSSGHSGYTHSWRHRAAKGFQALFMASVDDPQEKRLAQAQGWRTFRIRLASEPLLENEGTCPASDEGGNKTDCATCLRCDGNNSAGKSKAIVVHGVASKVNSYKTFRSIPITLAA